MFSLQGVSVSSHFWYISMDDKHFSFYFSLGSNIL